MARPTRALGFFAAMLAVAGGLVAWAIIDPHYFFSTPRGYVGLGAVALFLVQAVVYVPRAIRAARRR